MEKFKQIVGVIFLVFGLLGILICMSVLFRMELFENDWNLFGPKFSGDSASNSPAFFGLIAVAGALLLGPLKKTESK